MIHGGQLACIRLGRGHVAEYCSLSPAATADYSTQDLYRDVSPIRMRTKEGRLAQAGWATSLRSAVAYRKRWAAAICILILAAGFAFTIYSPFLALNSGLSGSFWSGFSSGGHSRNPREDHSSGLLAAGYDQSSCLSRFNASVYRKSPLDEPSKYLIRKLRQYETTHRRCGPHSESYNRSVEYLNSKSTADEREDLGCKYLVWIPYLGLGNRILSLASTFLYALLTDRVVLIHPEEDFGRLMCEPFPGTSWNLPLEFPIVNIPSFWKDHPSSYGKLIKDEMMKKNGVHDAFCKKPFLRYVYLHLIGGFTDEDSYFFCESDQLVLREIPWLFTRSDEYFVPALFMNSVFIPELELMFPEKEAVFHHLCRYLFHPSNEVWGMIARYYESYLLGSWKTVGIQIRVFDSKDVPFDLVLKQVINCTISNKILPEIDVRSPKVTSEQRKNIAVLVASLHGGYSESIRNMYWEHPAVGGLLVSVHQPSHEETQQTGVRIHDMKAWAEMYLLSYVDVLITSAQSTFGYVSQGLGGVVPWILLRPQKAVPPEPSCIKDISLEPCFHSLPHNVCKDRTNKLTGSAVPFVAVCKDVPWGIKLVSHTA